jgi:outer membrane receptor protein involved in Fe transport
MSGVLNMTTGTPELPLSGRVGVGILSAEAAGAGLFASGRGSWLAEVRRGSIDLLAKLLGDEDPQYWDAFAKLDYELGPGSGLRLNLLHSKDELEFEEVLSGESQRLETDYRSSYLWLTHRTVLGNRLLVETAAAGSWIDRDRAGEELEEGAGFQVRDVRDTEVWALRQGWSFQPSERQRLRWGFELRDFQTRYAYLNTYELESPLARLRHRGTEEDSLFRGIFDDRYRSFYLSDRIFATGRLTAELGLRAAGSSLTDGYDLDPRLNLVWSLGESGVLRASWGRFSQTQRSYELQVEDGDARFYPVEHSEHRILGFEKLLRAQGEPGMPGLVLRLEMYQRRLGNPRPRYENLFEPINFFPELEPDRVRIAPESSLAEGIELFLRGSAGPRARWWVNYAWARTEDRISGEWVPRAIDQTHTLNLDLDWRLTDHWRLNLAWRYHTGWPTTPLAFVATEDEEGEPELVPILGALNSARLTDYHRLDLRASRRWSRRSGELMLYIDVQNLYNRENLAGFDYEVDEESAALIRNDERFAGIIPSAGIRFRF